MAAIVMKARLEYRKGLSPAPLGNAERHAKLCCMKSRPRHPWYFTSARFGTIADRIGMPGSSL